jgi:phosphonate transport system substrate-binding protein
MLCGLAGIASASAIPANGEMGFSFGLTPVFLDDDLRLLSLLQTYLVRKLERPVVLIRRRTQLEAVEMLLSGQLDAAWICDFPYVQYRDRLAVLATPLYRNLPSHQAYVIVNEASGARTFDDIRGTQHAFSDPDSTSGYLITRWLLALRRESPAEFFRSFFFTYGHRNTLRAVATGLADSGSIEGYVWDVMREREPDLVAKTRIVFRSESFGFPPIVALEAFRELPATEALAEALLGMTSDRLGREILSILKLDGFSQARPGLYESTAEKWRVVQTQDIRAQR